MKRLVTSLAVAIGVAACSGSGFIGAVSCGAAGPSPSGGRPIPIGQLPSLDTQSLLEHTKKLSSDEFEGRAPGTECWIDNVRHPVSSRLAAARATRMTYRDHGFVWNNIGRNGHYSAFVWSGP